MSSLRAIIKLRKDFIKVLQGITTANPAAAKLFAVMKLSANDISAQNLRMRDGEKDAADIARHVQAWIAGHRATYDGWLQAARAAAKK